MAHKYQLKSFEPDRDADKLPPNRATRRALASLQRKKNKLLEKIEQRLARKLAKELQPYVGLPHTEEVRKEIILVARRVLRATEQQTINALIKSGIIAPSPLPALEGEVMRGTE